MAKRRRKSQKPANKNEEDKEENKIERKKLRKTLIENKGGGHPKILKIKENDKIKERKENLRKVKIGRIEKKEMQRKENDEQRKKMEDWLHIRKNKSKETESQQ